jgi:hypothetical protein
MTRQLHNHLPGLAKIAPWWLARRDNFSVNYRDRFPDGLAPPPLPAHTSEPLAASSAMTTLEKIVISEMAYRLEYDEQDLFNALF